MVLVGAYEAKTHLPRLLAQVEAGETIIITRHGKRVVVLSAPKPQRPPMDARAAIARWRKNRKGVHLGGLKIRALIDEGRR